MFTRYGLPLLALLAFGFAVLRMTKAQQPPTPVSPPVEPARSPYERTVAGAGLVEPESENIIVGTHLPGVVKDVRVRVGQRVRAGDPLFVVDDQQLGAELVVREAALRNARAQLARLRAMPRPEDVPPYHAKLAEALASYRRNRDLLRLADQAREKDGVSQDAWITIARSVDMAEAQVTQAMAELSRIRAGAWEQDIVVAASVVDQAEALRDQARSELRRLTVVAPSVRKPEAPITEGPIPADQQIEFRVLQVNVRPGEFVAATAGQPLIVLGTVGRLNVRVDIDENDIGRFREGIAGTASPRGEPGKKYTLRFVRVEPYVIPKKSLTGGNTERVDTRVLQVIYAIENADTGLYVGQQLDVALNAGPP